MDSASKEVDIGSLHEIAELDEWDDPVLLMSVRIFDEENTTYARTDSVMVADTSGVSTAVPETEISLETCSSHNNLTSSVSLHGALVESSRLPFYNDRVDRQCYSPLARRNNKRIQASVLPLRFGTSVFVTSLYTRTSWVPYVRLCTSYIVIIKVWFSRDPLL